MAKTKKEEVVLTLTQLSHLIDGTIRNLNSLQTNQTKNGYRFLLTPDPLVEDACIPASQEPETPDEVLDIAASHGVLELYEFFENVGSMKTDKDEFFRFFSTIEINGKNMAGFVKALAEIDENWAQSDLEIEQEEDLKGKIEGKNLVEGNDTIN
jgi:hypothetical protein